MSPELCPECDRLWREHSEVSQRSFRLEERLRHAQATEDYNLVQALATHLADLMHEQNRTSEAFVAHRQRRTPKRARPRPTLGD